MMRMKVFFFSTVSLILPQILDRKFAHDTVTINICLKCYQKLSVNEGARGMTKF